MKNRTKKGILLFEGVCVAIVLFFFIKQNSHVRFEDPNMGIVICNTIGSGVTPETILYKDLANVKELDIGYVGYYDTLIDIAKCDNIEKLRINEISYEEDAAYNVTHNEVGKILSEGEVEKLEGELRYIMTCLEGLQEFAFANYGCNCNIQNWDFLKECDNLKVLHIQSVQMMDCSILQEVPSVKYLDLWGSQIETADSLAQLQNIIVLCLYDTPIIENYEEIQKLCEVLPNTEILLSGEQSVNDRYWDWSMIYSE